MGKKKTRKSKKKQNTFMDIKKEIIGVSVIAISALMGISVYITQNGFFMEYLHAFLNAIFGVSSGLLPIFLIIYAVVILNNEEAEFSSKPIFLIIAILGLYSSFIFIYNEGALSPLDMEPGYLGAGIGWILFKVFAKPGSYVVLVCSIILSFILLTRKSVVGIVKKGVNTAAAGAINTGRYIKEAAYELHESLHDTEMAEESKPSNRYGNFDIQLTEDDLIPDDDDEEEVHYKNEDGVIKIFGLEESEDHLEKLKKANLIQEVDIGFWEAAEQRQKIYDVLNDETIEIEVNKLKEKKKRAAKKQEDEKNVELYEEMEEEYETEDEDGEYEEYEEEDYSDYEFPSVKLLAKNPNKSSGTTKTELRKNSQILEATLNSFGVHAKVTEVTKGPAVTRYELQPERGVKVSKIVNLSDDIALNLAASGVRIEAPIPGKAAIGIEIANKESQMVSLREVIEAEEFQTAKSKLSVCLGRGIDGKAAVIDLSKMPHLLIAGATGSGKSVCINSIIASLLYKAAPDEVKLIMIDPKVVELKVYNGLPHLLIPVVTEAKKAAGALSWAVSEMLSRYKLFAENNVKDLKGYNALMEKEGEKALHQIVIIIDELADLMMSTPKEVEDAICRLAQMARAAGMHLIIATQRPSVDVITGLIKANIPSRIAFAVSSAVDSRTILDMGGAEKLLGRGDMLYYPVGASKPTRVQGAYVSEEEIDNVVNFIKESYEVEYSDDFVQEITSGGEKEDEGLEEAEDSLVGEAINLIMDKQKASISMFQRAFRIGYNRAARLMDELEERGVVGPDEGTKPRKVIGGGYTDYAE